MQKKFKKISKKQFVLNEFVATDTNHESFSSIFNNTICIASKKKNKLKQTHATRMIHINIQCKYDKKQIHQN